MRFLGSSLCSIGRFAMGTALIAGMAMGSTAKADSPVWDSMTGNPNTVWFIPNNAGTPTGTGNRQMGGAITTSDPSSLTIRGCDITFLNATGAALVIDTTHRLRLSYWLWNTATPTNAAGTLAFSNLAGSGQVIFAPATAINLANNTFIQFQAVAPAAGTLGTAGTAPGIVFTTPITLTTNSSIGVAFSWQYDNATGTFAELTGGTSLIVGGSGSVAPALGTNALGAITGGNDGYYRSVSFATLDNSGNFNAGSARQVGVNSSVAYRLYAAGTAVNVCCNQTTGVCSATASSTCPSGSTFQANTACTPNPCPAPNSCCNTTTAACIALLSGSCPAGFTQQSGLTCTPSPCGLVPNDDCAGAIALNTASGAVVVGTNVGTVNDAVGGCGFNLVDGPSVWFKFTGTGNNVTVSTCDASTTLDTLVHVVCSENGCSGPFNCVGGNDDDAGCTTVTVGASGLTVPTIAGNQYYVIVNGFQGATGNFGISALDTGVASTVTTTCAARARCVIDNDPFDFAEADACGAGTGLDNNNSCATATIYPALGQIAKGTVSTTGNFRDIDIYKLPAAANGQSIQIEINAESPVLIQSLNDASGNCSTAFTVVANSTFNIAACVGIGNILLNVNMPATGTNYFLITTPSFDGNPCGTGANSNNDYRLRLSVATLGACCIPATACASLTFVDCGAAGGQFWFDGLACSLGTGNIDPCTVTVGRCCASNGTCSIVPSATFPQGTDCTAAGGVFTADANATCTPNPCAPQGGVCCRGATCTTTVTSAAACTSSLISGQLAGANFVSTATACGAGAISSTPCCFANYNKVNGITVQDIFDFLGDWFAGSRYANTGGNGTPGALSVQNIFDFLTNWFNGGCN